MPLSHLRNSLVVNCTVGLAAKAGGSTPSTTRVLVTINSSTFSGNTTNLYANRKGSAVGPHVLITATNSILWNGRSAYSDFQPNSVDSTNFIIRYCNVAEPYAGEGNVSEDPLFVNSAAHDFHLLPYSPAIDSGAPTSALDPDGSAADRGAFTFIPPSPVLFSSASTVGNGFQFLLHAYTNRSYVIESSPDSATWTFLKTVTQPAETNLVTDTSNSGVPHRFYRARLAP